MDAGLTHSEFAPYEVADSGRTVGDVFAEVNEAVWYAYGPDQRIGGASKPIAGSLFDFASFLQALQAQPRVRFVTHCELLTKPCAQGVVRIALRHDIDTDIVAALEQARIEAELGIAANWLVLHTAAYYGAVDTANGRFRRNEAMAEVYQELQALGHEVSLHADPLGLYQSHGIDGAQALTVELAWLRSLGLEISGTTAHNHRPTYGAENYEVFADVLSPSRAAKPLDETYVELAEPTGPSRAPLRSLNRRELGLIYEGNEAFWRPGVHVEYGAVHARDQWYWTERTLPKPTLADDWQFVTVTQQRVIDDIEQLPDGADVILVVHPEYFGLRAGPSEAPARSLDRMVSQASEQFGWRTHVPWSTVGVASDVGGVQTAQAINVANGWGMIDLPIDEASAGAQVIVTGGSNIDGSALPLATHLTQALANDTTGVIKLAHPGMAIDRLWSWIEASMTAGPGPVDAVVIVVEDADHFGEQAWPTDPGEGTYLSVDSAGAVGLSRYLDSGPSGGRRSGRTDSAALVLEGIRACCRWIEDKLDHREIAVLFVGESTTGEPEIVHDLDSLHPVTATWTSADHETVAELIAGVLEANRSHA